MEVFNLNIRPGKTCPVIHCSQFDKGRAFRANLYDGSEVYTLTGAETLSVIEKKSDGNMVTIRVTNTSDSYVEFATTEQMTAVAGSQMCELRIEEGDDLIGSLNFLLACEASPDTGIESDSAIHNLETQIAEIDAVIVPPIVAEEVANQYDSQNVIFDDHPTPGHGTGYVVKSENVPSELNDLDDVDISGQAQGEALVWDSVNNKWVNGTVSTVGGLNDLNDVTIDDTSLEQGQELVYNGTAEVFENKTTRVELTQAEYDALANPLPNVDYYITDAPSMQGSSKELSYDGSTDSTYDVIEEVKGDVTDLNTNKANKATTIAGYGITNAYTKTEVDNNNARRYTTLWGTSCQTTIGRAQFMVITNRVLYVVWLASTNDINVANVASNTYQSGTGSVTLDNVTFTRLSNSNLKVELSGSGTITIFG